MQVGRRFPAGPLKPARGGLFSAADVSEHTFDSVKWADADYHYDTVACPAKLITTDFCTYMAQATIAETSLPEETEHWPFGVVASYECLSPGVSLDDRKKIAIEQAKAGTQKGVENELWTGLIARSSGHGNAFLNNGTAIDVTGGTPLGIGRAIARLEQAMGDCGLGTMGVLHLTREAASLGTSGGRLAWDKDSDTLTTALGTPVAAGTGYDPNTENPPPEINPLGTTDPAVPGVGPSTVWAFVTGPVYVHLGPVEFISEQLDWNTNMVVTQAGRPAAVYWDSCCLLAVQIDLTAAA
jgi:hypothetical protein